MDGVEKEESSSLRKDEQQQQQQQHREASTLDDKLLTTTTTEHPQEEEEEAKRLTNIPRISHNVVLPPPLPPPVVANNNTNNDRVVAETPDSGMITQEEAEADEADEEGHKSLSSSSARKPLNFFSSPKNAMNIEKDPLVNASDHDDDDDDEDGENSSLSSAFSSDEEEEEEEDEEVEEVEKSLLEKAAKNRERNALFLQNLNEKYKGDLPEMANSNKKRKRKRVEEFSYEEIEGDDDASRGMLQKHRLMRFKLLQGGESLSSYSLPQRIKQLLERYPGREPQIRRMTSLLLSTIGQLREPTLKEGDSSTTMPSVHVPAPVFVIGPRGTGKTSVVCDVVQSLKSHNVVTQQQKRSPVGYAYINCGTLDPYSIERLVANAYNQLRPEEYVRFKQQRRKQIRMRKRKRKVAAVSSESIAITNNNNAAETTTIKDAKKDPEGLVVSRTRKEQQSPRFLKSPNPIDIGGGQSIAEESETFNPRSEAAESAADRRVQPERTAKALARPLTTTAAKRTVSASSRTAADSVEITHSAVIAFGRALKPFYGEGSSSRRCAMLVVDNGERLLTLSARKSTKGKTNFLAELLLLPKVMRLNLTIVVITRYSTIAGTRLNNISSPAKSLSTISSGLHPVLIQFPAYKGNLVFKKILKTEIVQKQILGDDQNLIGRTSFQTAVIEAFQNAIIQFLSDSTRDINDFIRVSRSYWPVFVEPISPRQIQHTMEALHKKKNGSVGDEDVLAHLGQRFFGLINAKRVDILRTPFDSPILPTSNYSSMLRQPAPNRLPYLRSCLLLAAFICQRNRPEQDKLFFSSQANGRRKANSRRDQSERRDENAGAFASNATELLELQSLRPRPFQIERAFSVFVSLIKLNPEALEKVGGDFSSLGSTRLHDDISQLIDLGYLHLMRFEGTVKGEQINLNNAKLWCSLTTEEAFRIAKEVRVPLQNFILKI